MNRNKFIVTMLTVATAPLAVFAQNQKKIAGPGKGFKVKAGEGRIHGHLKMKGPVSNIIDVKISGKDTDGGLAIFEQTAISQGRGIPLHVHHLQDEIFYIIDGEYYFQVGEEKHHLSAGDSIFLPRKVPHSWIQVSEKGKATLILQPAGKLEEFFVTVAALKTEPTPEEMAKIFIINEMEVVGPALKID